VLSIIVIDESIVHLALDSDFSDFEDALQYFSAKENKIPAIITRNTKDYKTASGIKILTAKEFLQDNER